MPKPPSLDGNDGTPRSAASSNQAKSSQRRRKSKANSYTSPSALFESLNPPITAA